MIVCIRWLLLPFSLVYGIGVWIRNTLYDLNILHSRSYPIKTIVVGNLTVGGAGKSPMTEYLIALFQQRYRLATLSRGYGRRTKGFRIVELDEPAILTGDEPLQFKRKFPSITVAVCEDRRTGIERLMTDHDLIILDDAFQHRRIKGKINLLLFDYHSLLKPPLPLPTGDFRDLMNQTNRADIVVVTKSPTSLPQREREAIERKIRKYGKKPIYYSYIEYGRPVNARNGLEIPSLDHMHILLVTGIANPKPLKQHLENMAQTVVSLEFPDHHVFSEKDYQKIKKHYLKINSSNKVILTTTKDLQRIDLQKLSGLPLYYIPISVAFFEQEALNADLRKMLGKDE